MVVNNHPLDLVVGDGWGELLQSEFSKKYMSDINNTINYLYNNFPEKISPSKSDIFKATKLVNPRNVKGIIIALEPYNIVVNNSLFPYPLGDGLAFSCNCDTHFYPKELQNIDIKLNIINKTLFGLSKSKLDYIAEQNILMLNYIMTSEINYNLKHKDFGWHLLTEKIISTASKLNPNIPILLLGNKLGSISNTLDLKNSCVIKGNYPSKNEFLFDDSLDDFINYLDYVFNIKIKW